MDNPFILFLMLIAGLIGLCLLPILLALIVEALPIVIGILIALWVFNAVR